MSVLVWQKKKIITKVFWGATIYFVGGRRLFRYTTNLLTSYLNFRLRVDLGAFLNFFNDFLLQTTTTFFGRGFVRLELLFFNHFHMQKKKKIKVVPTPNSRFKINSRSWTFFMDSLTPVRSDKTFPCVKKVIKNLVFFFFAVHMKRNFFLLHFAVANQV